MTIRLRKNPGKPYGGGGVGIPPLYARGLRDYKKSHIVGEFIQFTPSYGIF